MIKILKYSFYDLIRSKWFYVYLIFYLLLGFVLLFLNQDLSKAIITLLNVIVILVPLISTIFGVMYYYDSKEFTVLLMAQPIRRSTIFLGQYFGVTLSLSLSLLLGLGIPFLFYGITQSSVNFSFFLLIFLGILLSMSFSAMSFYIGLCNENKIKGFSYAILLWLFFAVIYDGLFLISLLVFQSYPLDNFALIATMCNPIDLSRTLLLLQLDISALMGYTGAVFQQFFGTSLGFVVSFFGLSLWVVTPILLIVRKAKKKDF
ncbi:ABC transporter permease [Joostella sp.]|uniref:ABC transporter permease n=1 Tax=Joostella sp. TaxID=2231138 RepID=UPI003A95A3E5